MSHLGDGFVFVAVPKCGSTSILNAMGWARSKDWHSRDLPDEALPRYAVCRNPYARALSMYHFERHQCAINNKQWWQGGSDAFYEDWRLDSLDGFLARLIENRTHIEFANFLPVTLFLEPIEPVRTLRLERLQDDWIAAGLPSVRFENLRKQEYDRGLSDESQTLVREWAAEDFERYGYC